jgi:starch phosphorylase
MRRLPPKGSALGHHSLNPFEVSVPPIRTSAPSAWLGKVRVIPNIPERLAGLAELSKNLWWTWSPLARKLFREIDLPTWIKAEGNPVRFLREVRQAVLDEAARKKEIQALYDRVMTEYRTYVADSQTWYLKHPHTDPEFLVAYFSMEYGIHHTLPNYSGGLGVLAGDHIKSATDLGVPLVAVGLLYREGYFHQEIDEFGNQRANYVPLEWESLPISPALGSEGEELKCEIELAGRRVTVKIWEVRVGRNKLYLLDTDIRENSIEDRRLTARLYGGDFETRIQQEILLGMGGVRALRKVGLKPTVFHMNEGHSVFLAIERLREFVAEGLSTVEAIEMVRASTVFTTHTPVPAGNDMFTFELVDKYFNRMYPSLGMSRTDFLELGFDKSPEGRDMYSLTALALRTAGFANGVSAIHGQVSRKMWTHLWKDVPENETPIDHITNGVHTLTWMSLDMQDLLDRYFPVDWRSRIMEPELWAAVDLIPDVELWEVVTNQRKAMIRFLRDVLRRQYRRLGKSPDQSRSIEGVFGDNVLTIGFARRFATYKRATLILRDKDRLRRLLNNPEFPVQIVYAGKAHPADQPGQELIRQIQMISREEGFQGKLLMIEDYDMNVGHRLTSGVDVWLNNPRKPLEASGTSGMKVPLNGGLNCSILDGWWPEAFKRNPLCGFALGDDERTYPNYDMQDDFEAESIYRTIETQIVPLFYQRDAKGLPTEWIRRLRESMRTIAPAFSTDRMVGEYVEKFYLPGNARASRLRAKDYEAAKELAAWKEEMRLNWPTVRVRARTTGNNGHTLRVTERVAVEADVDLGRLHPEDVTVEIYVENLEGEGPHSTVSQPMRHEGYDTDRRAHIYRGELLDLDSGEFGYSVRVLPRHHLQVRPVETGLVRWAS